MTAGVPLRSLVPFIRRLVAAESQALTGSTSGRSLSDTSECAGSRDEPRFEHHRDKRACLVRSVTIRSDAYYSHLLRHSAGVRVDGVGHCHERLHEHAPCFSCGSRADSGIFKGSSWR